MKKLLYVLLGLVGLYLVLALAGPSKIDVERKVVINRPAATVLPLLADMKFFNEKWNPWVELDSNMKVTYAGEAGKVGHSSSWEGNSKVGSGIMEITAITADSVTQKLMFGGHDGGNAYIIAQAMGDSCTVIWQMKSDIGFFARPFMMFAGMEKAIGEMYDIGLPKLKKAVEEIPMAPTYKIEEQNWEAKTYIGKREIVSTENNMEKLTAFLGANYAKLMGDVVSNKLTPLSAPSAFYFKWEEKQTDMAAVVAVPAGTKIKGWEVWNLPASKVLSVAYYGPDSESIAAHNAIAEYMKKNNLEQNFVVEEYVTDREVEKDPSKWLLNIHYVLK